MKKISIVDVADSLGVSKTLVSFVINGRGNEKGINKETQKKVQEKIKELGYTPNSFARSLRTGQSQTIGIVVADISNPFYARLCRSIEDYANAHNYNVLLCSSDENAEKEKNQIHMLMDRQVDGLIISPTRDQPYELSEMHKDKFPIVLVDRKFNRFKLPSVVVNNQEIARKAVTQLIDKGHKSIGLFCISPAYTSVMSERLNGYRMAHKEAGLRMSKSHMVEIEYALLKVDVKKRLQELMSAKNKITAVFSLNNKLTSELIKAAKALDINIPNDLSIISFDDIELFDMVEPTITAIKQPVEEMGKKATEHLLNSIRNKGNIEPCHIQLDAQLIERDSS